MPTESDQTPSFTQHLDGSQAWRVNGAYHRADGPAIIWPSGAQSWYWHGQMHRDDGPAYITSESTEKWYQHGKLHRTDGPAIVFGDGRFAWYLDDVQMTEKEFRAWRNAQDRQAGFNVAARVQKTDHAVIAPATARFRRMPAVPQPYS
ncbi:MAG TPA: hypothetical protein VEF76_09750 [Patescibacteria group bacterium]|nr:hypothetical protein [Patescibacteria group bacterium]